MDAKKRKLHSFEQLSSSLKPVGPRPIICSFNAGLKLEELHPIVYNPLFAQAQVVDSSSRSTQLRSPPERKRKKIKALALDFFVCNKFCMVRTEPI